MIRQVAEVINPRRTWAGPRGRLRGPRKPSVHYDWVMEWAPSPPAQAGTNPGKLLSVFFFNFCFFKDQIVFKVCPVAGGGGRQSQTRGGGRGLKHRGSQKAGTPGCTSPADTGDWGRGCTTGSKITETPRHKSASTRTGGCGFLCCGMNGRDSGPNIEADVTPKQNKTMMCTLGGGNEVLTVDTHNLVLEPHFSLAVQQAERLLRYAQRSRRSESGRLQRIGGAVGLK